MKRLWLVLLLLCTGCTNVTSNQNNDWNSVANYQVLRNGMSVMSKMEVTETSILAFPQANITDEGEVYIPSYIQDDQVILMDQSPSSSCSLEKPTACEYTISGDKTPYYYQGKLYYIGQNYDASTDRFIEAIFQSEVDGSNQKMIYTFNKNEENSEGWNSSFLLFHKGNMYAYHQDTLYIGDLSKNSFHQVSLPNISGIYSLFFVEDTMYVCTEEYDDGNTIHFYAVLACDLQGNIKDLVSEDYITYYIDNDVMFYLNKEENCTYMFLRSEHKHIKLLNSPCAYFFSYNDTYVVDGVTFEDNRLLVVDKQGTILKDYTYTDDFHYPQVYTGDKLYVWNNNWFGYYDLTADGITYHELKGVM